MKIMKEKKNLGSTLKCLLKYKIQPTVLIVILTHKPRYLLEKIPFFVKLTLLWFLFTPVCSRKEANHAFG